MHYRREIDGLRALAVVPVILFHAGTPGFSGGFIGVDVFFVISGYLITSLTVSQGSIFSLLHFYERRARPILPALLLITAVCIPFAWAWMLPNDMTDFAQSVAAVVLFSSNMLFWKESGYFASTTDLKPLLHTWSLGVEEQFYIIYPLVLLLACRLRRPVIALAAFAVGSLAFSQWATERAPEAAFYFLPARGWELLIGALAAFYVPRRGRQLSSLLGLAMIMFAVVTFDQRSLGPWLLIPTVGAVLVVVFAVPGTLAASLLGSGPFVGVGLVSYSLYLWHQPLFAFAKLRLLHEPDLATMLALSAVALALACVSWRFVERPFRERKLVPRWKLVPLAAASSALLIGFGVAGAVSRGFPWRASSDTIASLDNRLRGSYGLNQVCDRKFTEAAACRTDDQPEVVLWGDSYAMHLAPGLLASRPDLKLVQMTKSGCGPFLDLALKQADASGCLRFNRHVLDWLARNASVKYAVLSSPFRGYLDGSPMVTSDGTNPAREGIALDHFLKTLAALDALGIRPVVFSPPPQTGHDIGRCLARAVFFGASERECDFKLSDTAAPQRAVIDFLRSVSARYRVVWIADGICKDACITSVNGTFIYRDRGHLTPEGSALIGSRMKFYELVVGQRTSAIMN